MKNGEAPWERFNSGRYNDQYRDEIIWEDLCITRAVIGGLNAYGIEFGSLELGADVCNGGVVRGPALIAPYISDQGRLDWIDLEPQARHGQIAIDKGRVGDLGDWSIHQKDMGSFRPEWASAAFRACRLGKAVSRSIFELPKNTYDIAGTFFGPESLTEDKDEYTQALGCFIQSVKPAGFAIIASMYGSTGWSSAGVHLPAISIYQEDVLQIAHEEGLKELQAYTVVASHGARRPDDPFTYKAMGVVMGVRT